MAHYHLTIKVFSRSKRNTVEALAYRSGAQLFNDRTGEFTKDYKNKMVGKVCLVLPDDAPEWITNLQKEIAQNKEPGLQKLSDIVEAAEKRADAQIYRELEFSLSKNFTDAQNKALAEDFLKNEVCKRGIGVIANYHDLDNQGAYKPHCHALLLMRELEKTGFAKRKNREWNKRELHEHFREQWAAYYNHHLALNGFQERVDHRSYKERGIDLLPQPKLGSGVREMAERGIQSFRHKAYREATLANIYKITRNPHIVFDSVTDKQSTFVWADVQHILAKYIDDKTLFDRLEKKLKESPDLILLKEAAPFENERKDTVYTTKAIAAREVGLIRRARDLSQFMRHPVSLRRINIVIQAHDRELAKKGGALSPDQIEAIRHMTSAASLSCIVGYAGTGKTTVVKAAAEYYKAEGYRIVGLAPTGKAALRLSQEGIDSQVLHRFLKTHEGGREQLKKKTVLILDEAGMVDLDRFNRVLKIAEKTGCKIIALGDGAQLKSIEAGDAFRLVTQRAGEKTLKTVVRQREEWQRQATQLFGEQKTADALKKYYDHGAFTFVEEQAGDSKEYAARQNWRGLVAHYCLSRRIAGNVWHELLKEAGKVPGGNLSEEDWNTIKAHPDYSFYEKWKTQRDTAADLIIERSGACRDALIEFNVDPQKLARVFMGSGSPQAINDCIRVHDLPALNPLLKANRVDTRVETKAALLKAWGQYVQENPAKHAIMLAYTRQDTQSLNKAARHLMKEQGLIEKAEKTYRVLEERTDDFGNLTKTPSEIQLSLGDKVLFTRNDNGLKVRNGLIGTVTALSRSKIKVALDEEGRKGQTVSFAPALYPYFTNGWAANTHNAQGVTTDETFYLGAFEDYRNLSYVSLTRHKDNAQVFCSKLDFWRDEKVFDRLSASREKLSSLDYRSEEELKGLVSSSLAVNVGKMATSVKDKVDAARYTMTRGLKQWGAKLGFIEAPQYVSPTIEEIKNPESERAKSILGEKEEGGLSQKTALPQASEEKSSDTLLEPTQDGWEDYLESVRQSKAKREVEAQALKSPENEQGITSNDPEFSALTFKEKMRILREERFGRRSSSDKDKGIDRD